MERWHRAFTKNDTEFKELFGVKKEIFQEMLAILTAVCRERHQKGGRRSSLSAAEQKLFNSELPQERICH
ncbi:MAG: hypothetical protein FWE67_09920 [Planctomycetaceae bacterium]|nr:hypothetical protein [Planctomycetaceae bacterium]